MPRWSIFLLMLSLAACGDAQQRTDPRPVAGILSGASEQGFLHAEGPRSFAFPADHGPHDGYRFKWRCLTGHLGTDNGHRFGFQLTLFRIALSPQRADSRSAWRTNHIWMGHAALSDIQAKKHIPFERFSREGAALAGASGSPLQVWLEDWRIDAPGEGRPWRMQVPTETFELALSLSPDTPTVLQGDQGLSQKSGASGNASYYYSIPRLATQGRLRYRGETLPVHGLAWLDREWSTSALGAEQAGWDWFSLHLNDGRNLMYYQLRKRDGSIDAHSSGSISDATGLLSRLGPDQIRLPPLRRWQSQNRRYPVEWRLEIPSQDLDLHIQPLIDDQEMRLSVRYWEGAVTVTNADSAQALGQGYLEMTGYESEAHTSP